MQNYFNMKQLMIDIKSNGYKIKILSSCMDKHYSDKITKQK